MNAKELNRLIEKYYNGETSEEEEKSLREYFKRDDIPYGYETEKDIFRYYTAAGAVPESSADFAARIISAIDIVDKQERPVKFRKYVLLYLSAAAGMLILVGSWFFFVHRSEPGDTFTDPAIAYAETMKVLIGVSSQLNHATRALEPVGKINEMTTKSFKTINKKALLVEKSLKNLDYLQNLKNSTSEPVLKNLNK